ncbi:hypothetical protein G6F46_013022 [Rhizopus delemar]|uniref:Uncharacterized protein n=2 Tax=Rhizopus TaxID=4842 RepID=A0A9P6YIT2_9FUNG|nr:hypothetical protein G6F55_013519 [Rhizopus delemar]KAG1530871.1 hypothetical protein G6F51_013701 [Rhizopus arrhizus]KAG1487429.1 hypothetical protein G6F54_012665 [Rhizopus delemar]KAG1491985.1 hypothetical protein G6F53_013007 [Rhizopus delemar]KAG1492927.1 hypothetical protein G6F52_013299 [Rhizopus delemar]
MGSTSRNPHDCLFGRYSHPREIISRKPPTDHDGMPKINRLGLADKSQESITNTISTDKSPRINHRLSPNEDLVTLEKNPQHPEYGVPITETDDHSMNETGSIHWYGASNSPR